MEAVILDEQGKSSFQALQAALGDGGNPEKIVAYVFDLLHLDGKDLTKLPLTERKEKLEALLKKSKQERWLRYSEHIAGEGAAMFAKACEAGLEGIISKRANAPYVRGPPEKLAEDQMLAAAGIHHPRLSATRARAAGRSVRSISGYQEGRRAALCRQGRHRLFDEERARTGGALRGDGSRRNRS